MDKIVFSKPALLTDTPMHYCPGCTHGIVHRLIAEALGEIGEFDNVIGIAPVGCAVFAYNYFKCDMFQAAERRAWLRALNAPDPTARCLFIRATETLRA